MNTVRKWLKQPNEPSHHGWDYACGEIYAIRHDDWDGHKTYNRTVAYLIWRRGEIQ